MTKTLAQRLYTALDDAYSAGAGTPLRDDRCDKISKIFKHPGRVFVLPGLIRFLRSYNGAQFIYSIYCTQSRKGGEFLRGTVRGLDGQESPGLSRALNRKLYAGCSEYRWLALVSGNGFWKCG